MLYALCVASGITEMIQFYSKYHWHTTVSMDDHRCLTLFQLVLQTLEMEHHFDIIIVTTFACSDFIAQSILVSTTDNSYHYSSNSSKDILLLDYLGLQHLCCDHSIILSICILRYINLSSFTV